MSGGELKAWRLAQKWNQTQCARYLGTTQENVSRWEHAQEIPGPVALLVYLYRQQRNIRTVENYFFSNP